MKPVTLSMSRFSLLVASFFLVALATPAKLFADVEAGRRAANRGEYKKAYDEWRPLADAGNTEAQYNLGRLYANGDGVARSYPEAFRWFERAGLQGHKKAQEAVSKMYKFGDGVEKNLAQSELWRTGKAVSSKTVKVVASATPTPSEKYVAQEVEEKTVAVKVDEPIAIETPTPFATATPTATPTAEPTIIPTPVEAPLSEEEIQRRAYLQELVGTSPEEQPSRDRSPDKTPAAPSLTKALSTFGSWLRPKAASPSPTPLAADGEKAN